MAVIFIVIRFRRWRMGWMIQPARVSALAKAYRRVVAATTT